MREFTGLSRGRLEIKASQTIASHFLPPRLVDFHQAYPGVALVVSLGNSAQVVEAIIRGNIELGFVEGPEQELQDSRLAIEMIARDDLVMVVRRQPSLGDRGETYDRRSNRRQMDFTRGRIRDEGRLRQGFGRARRTLRQTQYRDRTPIK